MIDFSEITEQKISEKFEGLSQDLKDILSSANTSATIENIAIKYQLDEEKITMLIQLVGLVILGFATFEDIEIEMKEMININLPIIPLIADEIRQKIFAPVINSLQKTIISPTTPTPATPATPIAPATQPATPTPRSVDEYRELTSSVPEIVDLRKTPPISAPVAPKPIPSTLAPTPTMPSKPIMPPTPITPTPPPTFTRPVEPAAPATPLIEAEPHKIPSSALPILPPTPSEQQNRGSSISQPNPKDLGEIGTRPQYIMRPSGLPPTDLPDNVLDLRKDKGEF